ncbi:hypothetical protein [Endozoicomonas numazuensis]|uniref:Uncharacterized protein n=1 Tax=Endozoicomonas numazuensis TaxID=1137799 RepID=A0A081NDN3_9GAMM|nr:hypothetical protein [Endozoicomonas numazuensis]KEQ16556.1 hypothetical protein GZ78_22215 [Endozoicomonas numazuensis]
MTLNMFQSCSFRQLFMAATFSMTLFCPPASVADVDELLHTPGQQAAYSLFLAMQSLNTAPINESGDILLVTSAPFGLGDITYLVKLKQIIKHQLGLDSIKIAFFSDKETKNKAVQVFADQLGEDYLWIDTSDNSIFDDEGVSGLKNNLLNLVEKSRFSFFISSSDLMDFYVEAQAVSPEKVFYLPCTLHFDSDGLDFSSITKLKVSLEDQRQKMIDHRNKLDTYSSSLLELSRFDFIGDWDYWNTGYGDQTPINELQSYLSQELEYSDSDDGSAILRELRAENSCSVNSLFKDCTFNSLRFGFSDNNVGIYRDPAVDKLLAKGLTAIAEQLVQSINPKFLQRLTHTDDTEKQKAFFEQPGQYFFAYQHDITAKLNLIHAAIHSVDSAEGLKFVMPLSYDALTDPLVKESLLKAGISRVCFWDKDSDDFTLIHLSSTTPGVSIDILSPYPLAHENSLALMYFSDVLVGTTGNSSLFQALQMNKLVNQELIWFHSRITDDLAKQAEGTPLIQDYYQALAPQRQGKAARTLREQPERVFEFNKALVDKLDSSGLFQLMVQSLTGSTTPATQALKEFDSLCNQLGLAGALNQIKGLTPSYLDVIATRVIIEHDLNWHEQADHLSDNLSERKSQLELLKKLAEQINNPVLQNIMHQTLETMADALVGLPQTVIDREL